jgi:uncharacterized membrane protein YeaQ/YmgE (transglycosylase-associated protein family)
VNLTSPSPIPPGWYPDPNGERQWRVWNGSTWSELTRPYGEPVVQPSIVASLPTIDALQRLVRYGIAALFAGLGLVVSVLAHWPGTAQPTTPWFASIALGVGAGLLVIGSVCFGFAATELEGRSVIWAFIPAVNVLVVSGLVAQRLRRSSPVRMVICELILLGLFIDLAHAEPWLCVAPVLIAFEQLRRTSALLDQLVGPATTPPSAGP